LIIDSAVVDKTRDNHGGNNMPRGSCPECEAEVQVDEDTDKGDVVECSDCGTQLEVVGLDPIELDVADEVETEEDWTE
jgi:alpha-aminoadipate/glutamate carrier protein LysW